MWKVTCVMLTGAALAVACTDDPKKRVGETCTDNAECEGGVCGGGFCLDPAEDTDNDGLINRVEAALATDPVVADSDRDEIADGIEVGADTAHPRDSDGDGRIDAIESGSADCDLDGTPDQTDASDGLDASGKCRGVEIVSPCQGLCDRAVALGCPDASVGCLTSCSEAFTGLDTSCQAKMASAGECLTAASGSTCAGQGNPAWQLTPPANGCDAEILAVSQCFQGPVCVAATPLRPEVASAGVIDTPNGTVAYAAPLTAGKAYEVVVNPDSESDDPRLVVFESTQARCDWLANPTTSTGILGISDNGPGLDETLQIAPADAERTIELFLLNDSPSGASSFTVLVQEVAPL